MGDDPGQRARGRRPLRRDHHGHRRSSGRRWRGVDRPPRSGRRRRARHDDRPLPARRRGATARSTRTRGQHTADEIVAACVEARVPAAIVGNGAELPRNEQLAARNVFVHQPGESWIRPRAPFRFHGVADRELRRAGRGVGAVVAAVGAPRPRRAPTARRATGRSPGIRVLDFTAFWAGPFATAWLSSMGADVDQGRSGATTGRHPLQRRGAPARRPAVLREVGAVPRVQPRQARRSRSTSAIPTASRSRSGSSNGSDVVAENFTPQVLERFGLDWDDGARAESRGDHAAHARVRARRSVARRAAASRRRWNSSPAWRG